MKKKGYVGMMTRISIYLSTISIALLWSVNAHAANWETTFTSESLNSYIPTENSRVIVVRAGSSDAPDAVLALQNAFRNAVNVSFVMSPESLGSDISALDDKAIVDRCGDFPIDYVVIVRFFEGSDSETSTALVMIYQKDKQVAGAINATMGEAIEMAKPGALKASAPTETAEQPQPPNSAPAATEQHTVTNTNADDNKYKRLVEYDNNRIRFKSWALVSIGTGQYLGSWEVPYYGKYNERLEGERFFEVVNRRDLADEYKRRKRRRKVLIATGIASVAAGMIAISVGMRMKLDNCGADRDCDDMSHLPVLIAGGALTVTGAILTPVGMTYKPSPVTVAEMYKLAAEHNDSHQKRLGLKDEDVKRYLEEKRGASFLFGPTIIPNGGGFLGSVQF